jgi:hypothetical protein
MLKLKKITRKKKIQKLVETKGFLGEANPPL